MDEIRIFSRIFLFFKKCLDNICTIEYNTIVRSKWIGGKAADEAVAATAARKDKDYTNGLFEVAVISDRPFQMLTARVIHTKMNMGT